MDEEIKGVVFNLGHLKAPGPDGMNGLFFQKNWDVLTKDMYKGKGTRHGSGLALFMEDKFYWTKEGGWWLTDPTLASGMIGGWLQEFV
ncbi:hypothetical protein SESBI_08848 [Sesbania bispinosa]|nr:hypothetical protein SESBI_08848 [Sesbania bispinosa]